MTIHERAKDFQPEVVVCDWNLGGESGFETAKRPRKDAGANPSLLIVVRGAAQRATLAMTDIFSRWFELARGSIKLDAMDVPAFWRGCSGSGAPHVQAAHARSLGAAQGGDIGRRRAPHSSPTSRRNCAPTFGAAK